MLEISNLHVEVESKEILKGVDLSIPEHQVHALFGPNGSGKSVLISTIMGYPGYQITEGEILYNGNDISELKIDQRVKLGISALEQRPPTIKGVKLENLINMILQNGSNNQSQADELTEQFGMGRFLNRDINDGFSGGEIKKSEILLLIMAQPSFILLDEPDSGVDPEHLKVVSKMITKALNSGNDIWKEFSDESLKKGGIIATHSAAILDYIHTDKAHIMLDGKIKCSGSPEIMIDQIRQHGYEYCIKCQQMEEE